MHPCVGTYKYLQVLGRARAGSPEFIASEAQGRRIAPELRPHPLTPEPEPPMQTFLLSSTNRGEYFLVLEEAALVCWRN